MIYSNWEKIGLAFSLNELKTDKKLHFSHTQCPFYLKMKDEERVYFSSRSSDNISRVFYVKVKYSNLTIKLLEQKVYGPVLDIGNKEDFDSHGVMPSWIIKKGNNYDLYYIGWKVNKNFPYQNAIGLSNSKDGANSFIKNEANPIITNNENNSFFTGTSCIVKFNKIFFNYYMSCSDWITNPITKNKEPIYSLKIATSQNGKDWTFSNKTVLNLKSAWGGISKASVLKIKDRLHMWFSYRGKFDYRTNINESYKIGYATSIDGYSWIENNFNFTNINNINLQDDFMQAYPHVFKKNNNLLMLYNGNEFGKTGIFIAKTKYN